MGTSTGLPHLELILLTYNLILVPPVKNRNWYIVGGLTLPKYNFTIKSIIFALIPRKVLCRSRTLGPSGDVPRTG